MKKIFSVLLSLALVVSLGALSVAPVMAAAPTLPSISPTAADYDMDDPAHVAVDVTFGSATSLDSVEDDVDDLVLDTEYFVFEGLVVITEAYLDSVLDCIGDSVVLQFNFDLGVDFLTVTAIGTAPGLQSSAEDWDFWNGGDVIVGIDWGIAVDVDDVSDDVGSLTNEGNDWAHTATTLNITDSYLTGKLTSLGDSVELTVEFDSCDYSILGPEPHTATLTITAVGSTKPSIAPTTGTYDKCNASSNNDIVFTITWDGASTISKIELISDYQNPTALIFGFAYTVVGSTLTLKDAYLDILNGLGLTSALLRVTFDEGTEVLLYITFEWVDQPTLGLTGTDYTWDIETQASQYGPLVLTLVDFGCATNITRIYDDAGYNLTGSPGSGKCVVTYDYIVTYDPGYGFLIATTNCYLIPTLTALGQKVVLTVEFDKGADCTFSVTATGTDPSISPTSAEFNLDDPANVTATIDLGCCATDIVDITGSDALVENTDYTFDGQNLTIVADYLLGVLTEIGDTVALTIEFDEGANIVFTISAVGTPLCFIATAAGADAPQLDTLREFRDKVLRPNTPWLVSLYYEISPSIAKVIAGNEALKLLVKECVVDPATWIAEMLLD